MNSLAAESNAKRVKAPRWRMVIDLKRCYGCYACMMACKTANHSPPEVFWARVLMGEVGTFPNVVRQALPVLCMQCEEPSCVDVCPTGATYQCEDGIVVVDKDKCMGCKYCMQACPYGARYSVEKWESYFPDGLQLSPLEEFQKEAWEAKSGVGVATKCDFCVDRIYDGREPACVEASHGILPFGDVDNPDSNVRELLKNHYTIRRKESLGTEPSVYYIV